MRPNYRELAKDETIFSAECGYADSRHVTNLSRKAVPQALLDAVESGCPIETIDELANGFPICKYKTQITIHGRFPELSTRRIGGYINLVRNKNESVGIRWSAIDHDKKTRLFRRLAVYGGFRVHESSTEHYAYKMIPVTQENAKEVMDGLKAQANAIDKSLFFGSVSAFYGSVMGMVFACLEIRINAFYKANFRAILRSVTGMTDGQLAERTRSYLAEKRQKAEEHKAWAEKVRAETAERKRKDAEGKAAWIAANPCPFALASGYTLKVGDVFAKIKYGYGDGFSCGKAPKAWEFFIVKKAFGRLTAQPCDVNGNKLTGMDRYRKGHEIANPTGNFRVRVAV